MTLLGFMTLELLTFIFSLLHWGLFATIAGFGLIAWLGYNLYQYPGYRKPLVAGRIIIIALIIFYNSKQWALMASIVDAIILYRRYNKASATEKTGKTGKSSSDDDDDDELPKDSLKGRRTKKIIDGDLSSLKSMVDDFYRTKDSKKLEELFTENKKLCKWAVENADNNYVCKLPKSVEQIIAKTLKPKSDAKKSNGKMEVVYRCHTRESWGFPKFWETLYIADDSNSDIRQIYVKNWFTSANRSQELSDCKDPELGGNLVQKLVRVKTLSLKDNNGKEIEFYDKKAGEKEVRKLYLGSTAALYLAGNPNGMLRSWISTEKKKKKNREGWVQH